MCDVKSPLDGVYFVIVRSKLLWGLRLSVRCWDFSDDTGQFFLRVERIGDVGELALEVVEFVLWIEGVRGELNMRIQKFDVRLNFMDPSCRQ